MSPIPRRCAILWPRCSRPKCLRLILILTVADIHTVGPGVWNGWKGQLLRELYYAADHMMTGGDQLPGRGARVARTKDALAQRLADFAPEQRERALSRHYDNCWLAFDTDEQERHARAIARADAAGDLLCLEALTNNFRAITEVMLYTPDHAGLFSQFAGAIAMSGGWIVDAKVFTTTDGFALDVFSVQDAEGEAFGDSERLARLRQTVPGAPRRNLAAARADGEEAAQEQGQRLQDPAQSAARQRSLAHRHRGRGRMPGPARACSMTCHPGVVESGLSIATAMVATYGERAVDVFYVRDGFGHKIIHPERLAAIEARLNTAAWLAARKLSRSCRLGSTATARPCHRLRLSPHRQRAGARTKGRRREVCHRRAQRGTARGGSSARLSVLARGRQR